MEATYMSVNRWLDEETVVHTYNGIVFGLKKEGKSAICDTDIPGRQHAKWNEPVTEQHILYGFSHTRALR